MSTAVHTPAQAKEDGYDSCFESLSSESDVWTPIKGRYELLRPKGLGSFGQVALGKCKKTGQQVAIKLIQNFSKSDYTCLTTLREIKILKELSHFGSDHVPKLLDLVMSGEVSGQ